MDDPGRGKAGEAGSGEEERKPGAGEAGETHAKHDSRGIVTGKGGG